MIETYRNRRVFLGWLAFKGGKHFPCGELLGRWLSGELLKFPGRPSQSTLTNPMGFWCEKTGGNPLSPCDDSLGLHCSKKRFAFAWCSWQTSADWIQIYTECMVKWFECNRHVPLCFWHPQWGSGRCPVVLRVGQWPGQKDAAWNTKWRFCHSRRSFAGIWSAFSQMRVSFLGLTCIDNRTIAAEIYSGLTSNWTIELVFFLFRPQKSLIVVATHIPKVRGNAHAATMPFYAILGMSGDVRTKRWIDELLCWAAVVQLLKDWRCGEFGMFCGQQWTVTFCCNEEMKISNGFGEFTFFILPVAACFLRLRHEKFTATKVQNGCLTPCGRSSPPSPCGADAYNLLASPSKKSGNIRYVNHWPWPSRRATMAVCQCADGMAHGSTQLYQ